ILIASRPEPHIREKFEEPSFHGLYDSVNVERSFEDVLKYFHDEFSRIHREHWETMENVPTPWRPSNTLQMLIQKSSGYFIYASTVVKFIDDKYSRPTERLKVIQNLGPLNESDSPFKALDQLYTQILSGVPLRNHSKLCDILCLLNTFEAHPAQADQLLGLEPGEVRLTLRGVHSVLRVPHTEDYIYPHHASFFDFLRDRARS
ncbi:hypothetical protein C8R44DRAFT_558405, partial [Mycena epipterygia]